MTKLKTVLDHIKIYAGYYLAITIIFGGLWGGFVVFDNWKDDNAQIHSDIKTLIQEKKEHEKTDSILLSKISKLEERLGIVEVKTETHTKDIKGVKTSYLRYISQDEALTKEDFIRFIQEINGDSNIIYLYPYLLPKNKSKKIKP
jgi:hypothetical protein